MTKLYSEYNKSVKWHLVHRCLWTPQRASEWTIKNRKIVKELHEKGVNSIQAAYHIFDMEERRIEEEYDKS